jgi:hypothetical protein
MHSCSLFRLFAPAVAVLCFSTQTQAGPVALTRDDFALAIYASASGTSYSPLDSAKLTGFFGVHRCLCPATLLAQVQLTSSGQTNLGQSVIGVTFLLGTNCAAASSSCVSLGTASFSASQSAPSPTFSSSLIFQAAAGTTSVSCASLSAGSTTVWALLTQDTVPLTFTPPSLDLPVVTATVGAPTQVTAVPADQGLLVGWQPPSDATLVAGYQVLCLPRPATPQTAGYESCGLVSSGTATIDGGTATIDPADATEVCSPVLTASARSVLLKGLVNGTPYAVGVVAIDPSGGISAVSPLATGTPQPTTGFWEMYTDAGGAASGCTVVPPGRSRGGRGLFFFLLAAPLWFAWRGRWRAGALVVLLATAVATEALGQDDAQKSTDEWARVGSAPRSNAAPDWAVEVGVSWYRPAIDDEFKDGSRPFADTFTGARHPMWVVEVDRYLGHRFGTWGVGLRLGYYKTTAAALLADKKTPSGDETALRLIPISPSLLYRANGLPGLRVVPLIPYAKLGLDATSWAVSTTGSGKSPSGFSLGWHAAAGLMLGCGLLDSRGTNPEGVADPCALFFEWDYAAINGLGMSKSLHVGDNTWYAGIMFDL